MADLLECATAALKLQKKGKSVEAHTVQTRAQTKREAKAEQQAEVIRQAEQPVIKQVAGGTGTECDFTRAGRGPGTRHCGN